jgi:TDG/mug DNA glycosylase family protein
LERVSHGFGPFYDEESRILILGSFPSVKSREVNFYYGNSQNRFWKVIAAMAGVDVPERVNDKKELLRRTHIALYDVVDSCFIEGSKDDSITDVRVTDLSAILRETKIAGRIYTNGKKAHELYMTYMYPVYETEAVNLPSTSSANAGYSLEDLVRIWSGAIGRI